MPTNYVVLKRVGDDLRKLGIHACNGPTQAIRKYAGEEPATYVAVPLRNWTEMDADIEQPAPRLTLNEVMLIPDSLQSGAATGELEDAPADGSEHELVAS
jgi:hypothetical protein